MSDFLSVGTCADVKKPCNTWLLFSVHLKLKIPGQLCVVAPYKPSAWEVEAETREFKVILYYVVSLWPDEATRDSCLKRQQRTKSERHII